MIIFSLFGLGLRFLSCFVHSMTFTRNKFIYLNCFCTSENVLVCLQ